MAEKEFSIFFMGKAFFKTRFSAPQMSAQLYRGYTRLRENITFLPRSKG